METPNVRKLLEEGKIDEALKIAGKGDIEILDGKAKKFYENKDFLQTIKILDGLLKINPKEVLTHYNKGIVYTQQEKFQKAIEYYTKAIELDPKVTEVYNNRGSVYDDLNEPQKAIEDYTKAIELDPKNAKVYSNRGIIYFKLKEFQKAIEDYTKAIEFNPNNPSAYNNLGNVYFKLKEFQKAIEDYTKAIELDIKLAVVYNNRGMVYFEQEKFQKAIEDYTKAITLKDELPDEGLNAYFFRGKAYYKFGKENNTKKYSRKAELDFRRAIRLNPESGEAYNWSGVILTEINDLVGAESCFSKAIKCNPKNQIFRENLKKVRREQKGNIMDWWGWWFEDSNSKKCVGCALIIVFSFFLYTALIKTIILSMSVDWPDIALIGLLLFLLIVPDLKKGEAGPFNFEMGGVDMKNKSTKKTVYELSEPEKLDYKLS